MSLASAVLLSNVERILLFVVVLSVLIVLHEYGHFLIARLNGVRVNEFSVGMGPKLLGWRSPRSGTQYSVRALLIGGYCAMHGEDNRTEESEQQREFLRARTVVVNGKTYDSDNFQAKNAWQRLAIVAAGPFANFILTFAILLAGALAFGVQTDRAQPLVGILEPGMPAQRAGLQTGDRILALNGVPVRSGNQLIAKIHASLGKRLLIRYERAGHQASVSLVAAHCPPPLQRYGCTGFSPITAYAHVPFSQAVVQSADAFAGIAQGTFGSLALLASHPRTYGPKLSGVVGMGQAAITLQDFGWGAYFWFAAMISFALGVFNLLPIPALDGGRAAFILAEMLRGKPVDPEKEAMVHITGFAVLLVFMLLINAYNILEILQGKGPFQ